MSTVAPGTRVGPYEIVAPIGAGGMGEVWRGRDTRLDRSVAIKLLPAEFAQNAQLKLRFEREARAISQLNHPNICTLYDVGDSYLVMELLEGESLADRLGRGPLPVADVLKYGEQIAEALDRAHRAGIIHRDLKPGNVMITRTGAKLLDFGLAKSTATVISGDGATQHKPLTTEGTILGTFQYMAPEQLEGEEADARTDIFALGALLYEMSTGKRAFEGKTRTSLIAAIVQSTPRPISEIQPLTPRAFEHVVEKCLEKNRDDRWQSAHDVAEELRWIGSEGVRERPRNVGSRWGWIAAILAALALGIAGTRFLRRESPPLQYRYTIPMIDATFKQGFAPQLSPDGRTLYFRATVDGSGMVLRRRLDQLTTTPIPGSKGSFNYFVGRDGRALLLSFSGAVLKRISVDGGPLETLAEGVQGGTVATAISSNGTVIIGGANLPLRRLMPGGKLEMLLPAASQQSGESGQDWPVFLPDGEHYLFLATTRDAARGVVKRELCEAKLGSSEVTHIGPMTTRVEYAQGHLFFVRRESAEILDRGC